MWSGIDPSDRAVYRLVKSGESGLNLRLSDLFDKEIIIPGLRRILKTLFTGEDIKIRLKAFPAPLIRNLISVQDRVDKEVGKKIREAKSKTG